ncbi:hypothetical protein FA10DRAFT_139574 [Acaromyces ingoldii]|uniref:Uncharacterized protein n=1 Tax=Acaromyces ingoldii TaxID=215250 RepID=A0A316YI90_9BASI|nr:hypothetical protein FA10DRAFT_139574 [Acaromyces ingoldii]PWN89260.1 hypothetical protein FA10DRAFT_139574 [Acaromyces ingoldii]
MSRVRVATHAAELLHQIVADDCQGATSKSRRPRLPLHLLDQLREAVAVQESKRGGALTLQHRTLVGVARWAAEGSDTLSDQITLRNLLRGAILAYPARQKPERPAELVESLRNIELAQQRAEYEAMVSAPSRANQREQQWSVGVENWKRGSHEAEEWLEVRRQLSAIVNVGVSIVAVATSVWWAGGNIDPIWKTLTALFLSFLTAIAEVVLYSRHWDNARKRRAATSHGQMQ